MKFKTLLTAAALAACAASAQDALQPITLKAPNLDRPGTLMQAFSNRASANAYVDRALELQDLSDLLWAANGVNRAEAKKRTAPSAMNAQDVDIYVFLPEGAYLYDAFGSVLKPIAKGDFRAVAVKQPPPQGMPQPPVLLILVSDISRFTRLTDDTAKLKNATFDVGIVSQNIAMFCSAANLATHTRVSPDAAKLKEILKLSDTQYPMIDHPVGYPK